MPAGSGEAATRAWMAAVAVGLVAAAAVSLWQGRPDPDPRAVVRHFAGTALNDRCGSDGNPWPAGDPCADSRGYRFVLHRQGRFDVYLIAGGPRRVVSGTDDGFRWSADRAVNDRLLSAFRDGDDGA